MPLRGSSRAPEFDGDATELVRFFEDVKILCEDAELYSDAERIKWATRYASHSEVELWSTLALRSGTDWPAFMAEVKRFYPGAEDDDHKYMRLDLDRLVVAQASIPMSLRRELGEYIRKFTVIASFLEKKGRLSKGEREDKFLAGFHPVFKGQLMTRLTLAYLEHHPDDPWPTDRVVQHASFLLAGVSMATPEVVLSLTPLSAPPPIRQSQKCHHMSLVSHGFRGENYDSTSAVVTTWVTNERDCRSTQHFLRSQQLLHVYRCFELSEYPSGIK